MKGVSLPPRAAPRAVPKQPGVATLRRPISVGRLLMRRSGGYLSVGGEGLIIRTSLKHIQEAKNICENKQKIIECMNR